METADLQSYIRSADGGHRRLRSQNRARIQLEYSLVERNIEREHIPAAQELGLAICPWSPLASGFLSGKYRREGNTGYGDGRLDKVKELGILAFNKFTEPHWRILDVLLDSARQLNKPPAQVALNWVATQPGVTSLILGATRTAQLEDNLCSIEFDIPAELRKPLDEVSALAPTHPYLFFSPAMQAMISGGTSLQAWAPVRVYGGPSPTAANLLGRVAEKE